jgi:starch synthase (maltosyl-transferring)
MRFGRRSRYGRCVAKTAKRTGSTPPAPIPADVPTKVGRIPVLDLSPQINDNLWPAKAFAGEVVPFGAPGGA